MSGATPSDQTPPKQKPQLWKPGQSGNPSGRPKGARSILATDFLKALQKDFAEHGEDVIATVRDEKPDQYLKVIASILPKEIELADETVNRLIVNILRLSDDGD